MNMIGKSIVLVVCLAVLSKAHPHDNGRFALRESQDGEEPAALSSSTGNRSWRDCRERGESCRGFPPCCSDNVCYWENGFSATTPGICVNCVNRTRLCQRDGQCCESLICHKETSFTVNGRCDVKRPLGAECHDNDQCQSEYCEISWYNNVVMGHGGQCANR